MKVSYILVTNVTIKHKINIVYQDMSNQNMKVSNILVKNATLKQHTELI